MNALEIVFRLQFGTRFDDEAQVHVGYCPVLNVYSQGRSDDEAKKAVVSAAKLFLSTCLKRNILHNVLRDRGMIEVPSSVADEEKESQFISISGYPQSFEQTIPLHLTTRQEAHACQ